MPVLDQNAGHQAAIYEGFRYLKIHGCDHCIVMDSDGEDAPGSIPSLLNNMDADIVHVVRSRRTESVLFRLGYYSYKFIFKALTGHRMNFGNFCLINRKVLDLAAGSGFSHFAAFLSRQECSRRFIVAERGQRLGGQSKMGFLQLVGHAVRSFEEYGAVKTVAKPRLSKYIFILFILTLFLRIIIIPWYDNNFGGIEPNVIYGIQRILLGQPLYQDPSSGSYGIIQYTPLYYYFVAHIARIISPTAYQHGLDVHGLYTLSRILALAFNLLTVGVCALMIRAWRFSWWQSFTFAFPVLICLTVHYYTRVDSMHLFLFSSALYCCILVSKTPKFFYIILSALFSALCIMTKQSGALCAGIIGFSLLFIERRFLMFLVYSVTTCLLTAANGYLSSQGNWHVLYQNVVLGLKNGVDATFLCSMFFSRYFLDMVPCYIAGGILIYLAFKKITDKQFRILVAGAGLSWIFAAVTGLKIGSTNNYFTEFLLCFFVALPHLLCSEERGAIFVRMKRYKITNQHVAIVALLIIITSKTVGLLSAAFVERSFKNDVNEYAKEEKLREYFVRELHLKKGEHIFFTERRFLDNLFIEYSIMPLKDLVTQVYTTDTTTFNYTGFAAGMNSGLVKYIVTDDRRDGINICKDSLPFVFFDTRCFMLLAKVSGYCIYCYSGDVPKGSS